MTPQSESLRLLEEALKELESPKGSILAAVQKLLRASTLLEKQDIQLWCSIQLGEHQYVLALNKLLSALTAKDYPTSAKAKKAADEVIKELDALHLKHSVHYTNEELNIKATESGGGYISIGFIEERYADLIRTKRGNDGTYYKNDLYGHLNYVRKKTHEFTSALFNQLKFSGTVSNCFDLLKTTVDDRLLDLNPVLAEQLMLTFKGVSSAKNEEWSQALTTCRRLLEGLADQLYPASTDSTKGRGLSQAQYVNRLWAFMDNTIESDSNKELAKSHVDFLGAWLEKTNKITNKGVHAEVEQLEAVKAIFHTYLVVADLLDYLTTSPTTKSKTDINTASIDEIEALLNVSRATAKAIIKARVQNGKLDKALLLKVPGVGPKTLEKAMEAFLL
ncbi:MAG: DNA uptake protein [Gallionellales bacterium GWA2_60_142]|nr:MAG: DNA uptake protein [Gallionellales bacterium GWA2_60_142]HCI14651.1 DNA uptake protein [Gallionellaceae bacterium]